MKASSGEADIDNIGMSNAINYIRIGKHYFSCKVTSERMDSLHKSCKKIPAMILISI